MVLANSFTIKVTINGVNCNSIGINPQTGVIEPMPYEVMRDPVTRPKLYFKHNDILNQV